MTRDRRIPILGTLLLVLAVGSWWLQQHNRLEPERRPRPPHIPDYWVKDLRALSTAEDGRPAQRLSAAVMRHFPDDDSTELTAPELLVYEGELPPWRIRAERGWVSPDGALVLLLGEVYIDREASATSRPLHLVTRDLRVQPKDEYAETDQPVRGESGPHWVESRGMQAWLRAPVRIKLLAEVRAFYQVRPE